MANVRIGPDGSIIKNDMVVESNGRTIIREDGTIETTNVGGHSDPPIRTPANVPPASPLEQSGNRTAPLNMQPSADSTPTVGEGSLQRNNIDLKTVKEKEYDIQMMDGRIKNAIPKSMIIATIVLCILGIGGLYFLFIPAIVTGILIIKGFSKKSELETERARMCEELKALERGEQR